MCLLSARATQWLSKQQIESVPDLQDIEVPLASENPLEKANLAARKITNTDFMVEEAEENDTDGENGDWQDTLKESAESLKQVKQAIRSYLFVHLLLPDASMCMCVESEAPKS